MGFTNQFMTRGGHIVQLLCGCYPQHKLHPTTNGHGESTSDATPKTSFFYIHAMWCPQAIAFRNALFQWLNSMVYSRCGHSPNSNAAQRVRTGS